MVPAGTVVLLLNIIAAANVQGQTRFWNTVAGSWTNTANWTPTMVPNSSSDVEINNSGTATLDAAGQSQDVYLGRPLFSDGELEIIAGGQLTSRNIWIGFEGGGSALVNGIGSSWSATGIGKLTVGNASDSAKVGQLSIREGGSVSANGGTVIGSVNNSSGMILVNGSSLNANTFTIGERGTAMFQADNSTIQSHTTIIGKFEDPDATKYVAEAVMNGGTWTISSNLTVGEDGIGKLRLDAGTMTTSNTIWIGRLDGSDGEATIGGGTLTTNAFIYVGDAGKGRLTINSGASNVQTGQLNIGRLSSADGEVVVSGPRIWQCGGVDIGDFGKGTLILQNGATLKSNAGSIGSYTTTKDSVVSISGST
jgi:T5SS/PEP-CTERM-associated repeat protein